MFTWRPTEAFRKKVYVAFLTFRIQMWKGRMKEQDSKVFCDRGHSCGAVCFSLLFLFCSVFPPQMTNFPCLNWRAFFLFYFSNFIPNPLAFALLNSWFVLFPASHPPHSSTLAWKIPWMEEPGRLQSMGSLRVRHDWATSLSLFTFMHWRRKWQPTPVFLPGESQGRRSLVGCRLRGRTESDTTEVT